MQIALYQVDAFTDRPFAGNPAAVCPLEKWLPDELMQSIATENNLSETAFIVPDGEGWQICWFTPTAEIDLCGHATLASAFVIFRFIAPLLQRAVFRTRKAGELVVTRDRGRLTLDFPAWPPRPCPPPPGLAAALGREPAEVLAARDYLAVFENPETIAGLTPDFSALARLDRAVIVSAPGRGEADFVSRFFAPAAGVDEDPVTGSSHCSLIPYWAERLGRRELTARQLSRRGGTLYCALRGDRVTIAGDAVLFLQGTIEL